MKNNNLCISRIIIVCIICICTGTLKAQESAITIMLKGDRYMKIQACTDQIFRIRVNTKNEFPQTLMERYGILKTDWKEVQSSSKKEKQTTVIQTGKNQIIVNNETGDITVKDLKGKVIAGGIKSYLNGSHPRFKELQTSLLDYSGKISHGGGVIGDANFTGVRDSSRSAEVVSASVVELGLTPDERIYGGGTTSRKNIQHRGEILRMWTTYQRTEIPMPFLMSSNGWAIFNNTTSLNYFDVGSSQSDKMMVFNTDGTIDYYLMTGSSFKEALAQYVTITGKPYLLPKWAYGLAFGGNIMEDQYHLMDNAVRFREEKMPLDVMWIEPQWMAKNYDYSTKKGWNLEKFQGEPYWELDRKKKYENKYLFISRLHKLGYKLALWLCIDHDLSIAEEDHIAEKSGKPVSGQEHWFDHLMNFVDQGVDGFKLDPGNTIMEHAKRKYYNGYTDKEMHNLNQVLMPKQFYETFRAHKGIRSFHHYCGGYSGTQHWAASTSGDNGGGKNALFDQLNLGFSGFVNTSVDVEVGVGSLAGMHFGFFLPWVQVNSWYALLQPWYLTATEKETFRFYDQLRYSLIPYIYSAALEGSQSGLPVLRPMPLEFPNDRSVDNMVSQYMFGENLLVGVFNDSIYLPQGEWTNFWTGEKVSGPKKMKVTIPKNRGGHLFVRQGAIIPYQKQMQYVGERPLDTLLIKVFPHEASTYTLWEDDGKTFEYETGKILKTTFECSENDKKIEFSVHNAQGEYKGYYRSRVYSVEFYIPAKPSEVTINGIPFSDWVYSDSGSLLVSLSQKDVHTEQVVVITR